MNDTTARLSVSLDGIDLFGPEPIEALHSPPAADVRYRRPASP